MKEKYYKGLIAILNEYCNEDTEQLGFEPLDGDEVDILTEHIRNNLNLLNGNITNDEYEELEKSLRSNRLIIDNLV